MLIQPFDPWKSKLCSCPKKFSFSPYTGCGHKCIYCYASSYIKRFFEPRLKKDVFSRLEREARGLKGSIISIANSSDPYQPLERKYRLMPRCLEILGKFGCRVLIVTKSELVVKDVEVVKRIGASVSFTITTLERKVAKRLEPGAPSPRKRIEAVEKLVEEGIGVSVRIDPVIPFLNEEQEELIEVLGSIGVRQIISSTYKVRPDNWQRFRVVFPEVAEKVRPLYFEEGERVGGYRYLPKGLRFQILKRIKELAEKEGMKFSCCREGFFELNSAKSCDGSWLIKV